MRNVWWRFDCSPSEGEILSPQQQSSDCKVGLMDCGMGALAGDQEYFQKNWEVLEGIRNISQKFGSSWKGSGKLKKKIGSSWKGSEIFQKNWELLLGIRKFSKNIVELLVEIRNIPKILRGGSSWLGSGIFQKKIID